MATALLLVCLHLLFFGEVAGGTVSTERTNADVIGASIAHPAEWSVERERHTFEDTYGFTLWRPEPDPATHDHGGTPAVRVALAYGLEPGQIEAAVREKLAAYQDPATYYRAGDEELIGQEEAAREEEQVGTTALSGSGVPVYDEKRIGEGCWRAKSTFFFQTQHGMYAN